VADSSGNNLHGRLVGDAQVYADPERGSVLRLDGAGDWVDCGADAKFNITDEITISAWIKVVKFDQPWHTIISKGNYAWRLGRDRMTDALAFCCFDVDSQWRWHHEHAFGRVNVNDGRWHHIAGVYGGGKLSLYVDGRPDTFAPAGPFWCINTPGDHVLIGGNAFAQPPQEWNGLIDDVRIYNYAVAPEDIKALHEGVPHKRGAQE
jgi:hypothetical protein